MTPGNLVKHVGCGDLDNMGQCSTCDAIRVELAKVTADRDALAAERSGSLAWRMATEAATEARAQTRAEIVRLVEQMQAYAFPYRSEHWLSRDEVLAALRAEQGR